MRQWETDRVGEVDEIALLLRALPTLPAPTAAQLPKTPRCWLTALKPMWLLLVPIAAYLFQPILSSHLMSAALRATPYPYWQQLLSEAQSALQTGLRVIQEVLG